MANRLPRLGVTVGDPAGIGPEIIVKALASSKLPRADYVVYGPPAVFAERARRFRLPWNHAAFRAVDVEAAASVALGVASAVGGRIAAEYAVAAARDALAGRIDAVVTAPLNKESLRAAGYSRPGHTELLAEVAGVENYAMMFVGGPLRIALLTIHQPLASVPRAVTGARIERLARLVDRELPRFGAARRRIALCGLNPHAGEGGLFGVEEAQVHAPAVARLKAQGLDVHGPLAADTVFVRAAKGEFDAVLANYHDQGLIPVKLLAFGESVNVTLGLPFVRTSVDHGTGFDIAAQGVADEGSLLAAMRLAVQLILSTRGEGGEV